MNLSNIPQHRLLNQQIAGTRFETAKEIVGYLGAVQAQDYAMAKWAIGLRLPDFTDEDIEQAIDKAEIVRTHILRPTWHFVAAEDIRWMLALTAPQINTLMNSTNRKLELDATVFKKSNALIEKALEGGKQLTREELMTILEKAGIATNDLRSSHLMFQAELEGIVCNGSRRGKQFTYALLDERIPPTKPLHKEEALETLAKRYFTSHSPATVQDFSWWSGLTLKDARAGLEMVKSNFLSEKIDAQTYWFSPDLPITTDNFESLHFLPAFDEFLISYKDRSASINPLFAKEAMTVNGIFKPIIVLNGKVIGIWKRTLKKDVIQVENYFFTSADSLDKQVLYPAIERFGRFLGLKIEIS